MIIKTSPPAPPAPPPSPFSPLQAAVLDNLEIELVELEKNCSVSPSPPDCDKLIAALSTDIMDQVLVSSLSLPPPLPSSGPPSRTLARSPTRLPPLEVECMFTKVPTPISPLPLQNATVNKAWITATLMQQKLVVAEAAVHTGNDEMAKATQLAQTAYGDANARIITATHAKQVEILGYM